MSLNKVLLIGNVGKDPEIRYIEGSNSSNNTKVATFPLATSERFKDRNGELRENTEWHNLVAWRNSADIVEKYVKKGTQLFIEGRIRTRSWTDQNNVKKYTTEIVVDNLQLLGRKSDNPASAQDPSSLSQTPNPVQTSIQTQFAPAQGGQTQFSQTPAQAQAQGQPSADQKPLADDSVVDDLPF